MLPLNLLDLARTGVHIELTKDQFLPLNLVELIRTVANAGGHITIDVQGRLPLNYMELAQVGRTHLTFRW